MCQSWKRLALDPILWRSLLPAQWLRGDWSFTQKQLTGDTGEVDIPSDASTDDTVDEEGNEDEDLDVGFSDTTAKESRFYSGLVRYLMPRVGVGVRSIALVGSRGVTNAHIRKILLACPNVRRLDLSYTNVGEQAFAGESPIDTVEKNRVFTSSLFSRLGEGRSAEKSGRVGP